MNRKYCKAYRTDIKVSGLPMNSDSDHITSGHLPYFLVFNPSFPPLCRVWKYSLLGLSFAKPTQFLDSQSYPHCNGLGILHCQGLALLNVHSSLGLDQSADGKNLFRFTSAEHSALALKLRTFSQIGFSFRVPPVYEYLKRQSSTHLHQYYPGVLEILF